MTTRSKPRHSRPREHDNNVYGTPLGEDVELPPPTLHEWYVLPPEGTEVTVRAEHLLNRREAHVVFADGYHSPHGHRVSLAAKLMGWRVVEHDGD